MEGCSLQDAFPGGPYASTGCLDNGQAEISRRQEKKKARRCRGPALTYLNEGMNMVGSVDPDRQTVIPMAPVPAMNQKTGLTEHAPVSQQYDYETFVGGMDSLPAIRKDVESTTALQPTDAPKFFGAGPNDSNGANKKGLVEAFQSSVSPFVNIIGTDESYLLQPDFTKTFSTKGVTKAESVPIPSGPSPVGKEMELLSPAANKLPNSILPTPNLDIFWKQSPLAGGQSSFFSQLDQQAREEPARELTPNRQEVLTKLDKIFARLGDLEQTQSEHAQTEILLFIMTGLGVIFLMDVACRAVARR
jgi:hypothetical protein